MNELIEPQASLQKPAEYSCARCSGPGPLNMFRLCTKCFIGWFDAAGTHCAQCSWVSNAPLEAAEMAFQTHLRVIHGGIAEFTHAPGGQISMKW